MFIKSKEPRISCYSKPVFFPFFPQKLMNMVVELTKKADIFYLEKVYATISQCIYQHREDYDKTGLLKVIFVLQRVPSQLSSIYAFWISFFFSVTLYCFVVCAKTTTKVRLFISVWKAFIHIAKPLLDLASLLAVSAGKSLNLKTMSQPHSPFQAVNLNLSVVSLESSHRAGGLRRGAFLSVLLLLSPLLAGRYLVDIPSLRPIKVWNVMRDSSETREKSLQFGCMRKLRG